MAETNDVKATYEQELVCSVCLRETTNKEPLKRCSTCKNRFYCVCILSSLASSLMTRSAPQSAKCQKKDWKEHKWNCSVLPVDGLPAATVVEIDDQFKKSVKGVVAILKEVADALKDDKTVVSKSMVAPLLRIPSELPPSLHYKRAIEDSDKYPYRLPIITACRVLLIDYISGLDVAQRQEYENFLGEVTIPTSYCEMYGPKIVGRPADLSPGEYTMLAQVLMPMWISSDAPMLTVKADTVGTEKGENTDADVGEEGMESRWPWLAIVLRRAYDAAINP
ncbi:hypothetical protein B0H12DRAFT_57534 [Mycena haematopus]|nr:hypothetical protein B0H12DRAFT_57534 [Mycena haematopus]